MNFSAIRYVLTPILSQVPCTYICSMMSWGVPYCFGQVGHWCGRGSCYGNKLSLRYLSNSRSKKEVNCKLLVDVKCGRNVLTSFLLHGLLRYLRDRWIIVFKLSLLCEFRSARSYTVWNIWLLISMWTATLFMRVLACSLISHFFV